MKPMIAAVLFVMVLGVGTLFADDGYFHPITLKEACWGPRTGATGATSAVTRQKSRTTAASSGVTFTTVTTRLRGTSSASWAANIAICATTDAGGIGTAAKLQASSFELRGSMHGKLLKRGRLEFNDESGRT